jgi:hypothetical protein
VEGIRYCIPINPVRGVVLAGPGHANGAPGTSARVPMSKYRGYTGLEKMKSFLDGEPIQGVFQSYSGRCWKAWEIVAGWKGGQVGTANLGA